MPRGKLVSTHQGGAREEEPKVSEKEKPQFAVLKLGKLEAAVLEEALTDIIQTRTWEQQNRKRDMPIGITGEPMHEVKQEVLRGLRRDAHAAAGRLGLVS